MTRLLLLLTLAACTSTSAASHLPADNRCKPIGANLFCLCPGGKDTGTQECLADGTLGPCLPCPVVEPVTDAGESLDSGTAPDNGSSTADVGPPPGDSSCPGTDLGNLSETGTFEVNGSTLSTLASATGSGFCGVGAGAHDAAFTALPSVRGRLSVTLKPAAGFDAHLYARAGTCDGPQVACSDFSPEGGVENIVLFSQPNQPVRLFVDGKGAQSGTFQLSGKFEPGTFCGDGTVDPGEVCDDGNVQATDGCSPSCGPDGYPVSAATCPGQPLNLWSLPVEVSATSAKNPSTFKGSCGGGGRESVYAVTVHQSGKLTARVTWADFDTMLYARKSDCVAGVEAGCSNDVKKTFGGDSLTVDVSDGETVFVFVDGINYGKGAFHLRLSFK